MALLTCRAREFFCCGSLSCALYCKVFSRILGLYPLDANCSPQVPTTKNISRYFGVAVEAKITPAENTSATQPLLMLSKTKCEGRLVNSHISPHYKCPDTSLGPAGKRKSDTLEAYQVGIFTEPEYILGHMTLQVNT